MNKKIILIILTTISNMFSTFEISTKPLSHNAFGDAIKAYEIWYKKYGDKYKDLINQHIGTTEHIAGYIRNEHILRVNFYRSLHGVPELKMHKELNYLAQILANHIVLSHYYEHGPTINIFGENLNLKTNWLGAGNKAADQYYDEFFRLNKNLKAFDFDGTDSEMSDDANSCMRGHALTMIWKDSKEIGVGVAYGDWFFDDTDNGVWGKNYVIVTLTNPGSIIRNEYKKNILPRIKSFERLKYETLASDEEPDNVLD